MQCARKRRFNVFAADISGAVALAYAGKSAVRKSFVDGVEFRRVPQFVGIIGVNAQPVRRRAQPIALTV